MSHSPQPEGRGIYVWPSGDRYEGEWRAGRENGVGTSISMDGSTYYGFFLDGRMHGEGVSWSSMCNTCRPCGEQIMLIQEEPTLRGRVTFVQVYKPAAPANRRAEVIFLREYEEGRLVNESVLRVEETDMRKQLEKRAARKTRQKVSRAILLQIVCVWMICRGAVGRLRVSGGPAFLLASRVLVPGPDELKDKNYFVACCEQKEQARPGETIIKGHRSYDLVRDLQLGIMFSVAKAGQEFEADAAAKAEQITEADFKVDRRSVAILYRCHSVMECRCCCSFSRSAIYHYLGVNECLGMRMNSLSMCSWFFNGCRRSWINTSHAARWARRLPVSSGATTALACLLGCASSSALTILTTCYPLLVSSSKSTY